MLAIRSGSVSTSARHSSYRLQGGPFSGLHRARSSPNGTRRRASAASPSQCQNCRFEGLAMKRVRDEGTSESSEEPEALAQKYERLRARQNSWFHSLLDHTQCALKREQGHSSSYFRRQAQGVLLRELALPFPRSSTPTGDDVSAAECHARQHPGLQQRARPGQIRGRDEARFGARWGRGGGAPVSTSRRAPALCCAGRGAARRAQHG